MVDGGATAEAAGEAAGAVMAPAANNSLTTASTIAANFASSIAVLTKSDRSQKSIEAQVADAHQPD
jgi:hypothetical protein